MRRCSCARACLSAMRLERTPVRGSRRSWAGLRPKNSMLFYPEKVLLPWARWRSDSPIKCNRTVREHFFATTP